MEGCWLVEQVQAGRTGGWPSRSSRPHPDTMLVVAHYVNKVRQSRRKGGFGGLEALGR
jgi:hypothetical protein